MTRQRVAAPLDDPTYAPAHPPVNGRVPDAVGRWGPRSQLRWFRRFRNQLAPEHRYPRELHCESPEHPGPCCRTCDWEFATTGLDPMGGAACCCQHRGPT